MTNLHNQLGNFVQECGDNEANRREERLMAVEIEGRYTGGLGVELVHGPSGAVLKTAAPVDNQGDGSSFSPTDLVASALGACMLTIVGIVAERDGIDLEGLRFSVQKHMTSGPRRIGTLEVRIDMPTGLGPDKRKVLERAALTCPVHRSLSQSMEKNVTFAYPD